MMRRLSESDVVEIRLEDCVPVKAELQSIQTGSFHRRLDHQV